MSVYSPSSIRFPKTHSFNKLVSNLANIDKSVMVDVIIEFENDPNK